jgi:hypothetical protein
VDELVVVAGPPADPVAATDWVMETAAHWMRSLPSGSRRSGTAHQ